MSGFITPQQKSGMLGTAPIFKSGSASFSPEVNAQETEELRALVLEKGCQQRGSEDICRACGSLALDEPMCRTVRNVRIETSE